MQAFHEQRAYPDGFQLIASRTQGLEFLAHWQDEAELLLILSGEQHIGISNQQRTLSAGQVAYIAPGDIHYYPGSCQAHGFLVIFPHQLLHGSLPEPSTIWTLCSPAARQELTDWLEQMHQELQQRSAGYNLASVGLLHLCLSRLIRPASDIRPEEIPRNQPAVSPIIHDVLAYLDLHYGDLLGRDQVAERFNLSPAHFSRSFKQATGLTFTVYLNQLRLQKACSQLRQTRLPVTDIALGCGFESIRTFNRVFRRYMGCQPTTVRQSR